MRRNTVNDDKPLHCDPLENGSESIVCAIKLLLVLALRLGRVHGSTLGECLRRAARRADATVQWADPDAAVLGQMKGHSPFIVFAKPAGQEQVRHSLQEMAQLAGILEDRIDTRALRRGALRDQAYIKKVIAGVASRSTAMIAGHSNKSYERGTTRDYVGALEDSMYNLRAEHERVDQNAPAFAQEGPSAEWVQERAGRREVDDFMKTQNMEIGDANARKRAAKLMRKQREEEWRAEQRINHLLSLLLLPATPSTYRHRDQCSGRQDKQEQPSEANRKGGDPKYFSAPPLPASATTLPAR